MSWKVLMTAMPMGVVGRTAVEQLRHAGCEVVDGAGAGPVPEAKLMPMLEGVDAVIAGMEPYNAKVLAAPQSARLKIISRWGVGFDAIDLSAATKHGVVVANTPGLLNEAVADYTFALLLALARRVHEGHVIMRQGEWKATWGSDVAGKTLGILGCGRIGQAVARRAAGFDLRLIGYDVAPNADAHKMGVEFVSLDELLAESDFLCLHAALTPENRGLIGEAQLRRMKRTAYLVNTARGALVDENALVRALTEGWIAGAALDAFTVEPLAKEHPLRSAPNVLLTPHQASYGFDTGAMVSAAAAGAVLDLLAGKRPKSVLNGDVWERRKAK
ncbi:MAG: phosphoglycerate dehydrogenase [Verrucomicrobiota bacterium]